MRGLKTVCLTAVAAALIAGCQGEKTSGSGDGDQGESRQAKTEATPKSRSTPIAKSTPIARKPTAIPLAIRGRWGLVPADCTSSRGDAKGLLVIDANSLTFYESHATLKSIREADEGSVDADFAFTGEGQSWSLNVSLDVKDDGQTMIRRDTGADAMPGSLTYTRC